MTMLISERPTLHQRAGSLIGMQMYAESDMVTVVEQGLPTKAYHQLVRHVHLEPSVIASESTMRRRLQKRGGKFSQEESEKLMRVAWVFALAAEVFGEEAKAKRWFSRESNYLPGQAPISPMKLCETDRGGRLVEEYLRRAQYGFAA